MLKAESCKLLQSTTHPHQQYGKASCWEGFSRGSERPEDGGWIGEPRSLLCSVLYFVLFHKVNVLHCDVPYFAALHCTMLCCTYRTVQQCKVRTTNKCILVNTPYLTMKFVNHIYHMDCPLIPIIWFCHPVLIPNMVAFLGESQKLFKIEISTRSFFERIYSV